MIDRECVTKVLLELVEEGLLDMGVDPMTGDIVFWNKVDVPADLEGASVS